jgi:hypothetical protein
MNDSISGKMMRSLKLDENRMTAVNIVHTYEVTACCDKKAASDNYKDCGELLK